MLDNNITNIKRNYHGRDNVFVEDFNGIRSCCDCNTTVYNIFVEALDCEIFSITV